MKTLVALIVVAFSMLGCSQPDDSRRVLESAGYTNVQIHGYGLFGCSDDDFFRDRFTAVGPNGKPASGVVCAGVLFKGATIRLD